MRIGVFLILILLLPIASAEIKNAELKHGDTYRYQIKQLNTIMLSGGYRHSFTLLFYQGNSINGATISQGSTIELVADRTTIDSSVNSTDLVEDSPTWLANETADWDVLWLRPTTENMVFSLKIGNHGLTFYDGYDSQGFFVDQTAFERFAGGSYVVNATTFGMTAYREVNYTISGEIHYFHTEYTEYYEVGSGMLLNYHAYRSETVAIVNGFDALRTMGIHLVSQNHTTTRLKISYHPMFIALLPLVLLKRKRVS